MKSNIIFLEGSKKFSRKEKSRIKNIIKKTANHAAKLLKLNKNKVIVFTVYFKPGGKFVSGFAEANDLIHITINKRDFREAELKSSVYHELHHIARDLTAFTKRKVSLIDNMMSEGMAVVFEMKYVPEIIPPYSKYTKQFIKKWLPEIKKEGPFSTDYVSEEWFWGKRGKPLWLIYKLGTYLIHQALENNPKLKIESLIKKNDRELLKLSKVKL